MLRNNRAEQDCHPGPLLADFDRPALAAPLGRYLQMPFCRKRCKFCSFRVDTSVAVDSPECRRQLLTA